MARSAFASQDTGVRKVRQLPVDFQSHDLRGMYACGDQGPGELSRTAADVHDTAVILEIPHGKGGYLPGLASGVRYCDRRTPRRFCCSHSAS